MYREEIEFLKKYENSEEKTNKERVFLSESEIESLKSKFPDLPLDYIEYLKQIGWGTFRECQFNIFEAICYLEDLYDVDAEFEEKRYLAFGDNFSGDTSLFDTHNNYEVVEFWHDSYEFHPEQKTFKQYIRSCMLMSENGSDERVYA